MDFQLTEEQKRIVASLDEVGRDVFAGKAARWDENHEYPWENIHLLREMGVLGMTIPEAYGGQGSLLIDAVLAIETTAKYCGVTARAIVETNMGALGCVMAYGTDAQRELVARRILEEGDKPAIGMTEPEAGTALTDLATTAEKTDGGYVVNGTKHWITGGGVSVSNLIFARFIEDGKDLGIGGILVTAAPDEVPQALLEQLDEAGGRLIIPVGPRGRQDLLEITRHGDQFERRNLGLVSFVPLLGGTA